jgi:hypothetical protein
MQVRVEEIPSISRHDDDVIAIGDRTCCRFELADKKSVETRERIYRRDEFSAVNSEGFDEWCDELAASGTLVPFAKDR